MIGAVPLCFSPFYFAGKENLPGWLLQSGMHLGRYIPGVPHWGSHCSNLERVVVSFVLWGSGLGIWQS